MPNEKNIISENPRQLFAKMNKRLKRMTAYLGEEHDSIQLLKHQLDMIYGYESIGVPTFKTSGVSDAKKQQLLQVAKTYEQSSYSTKTGLKKSLANKGLKTFTQNMSQSQVIFWDTVFSSPSWGRIKELFYEDSDRAVASAERVQQYTESPYALEDIFSAWSEIAKEDKPAFRKSVDAVLQQWTKLDEDERNTTNFKEFALSIMTGM